MIKKTIIIIGLGIGSLHSMDQDVLKERLERQYKLFCETADVFRLRSAYDDLIRLHIADKEELDQLIRLFEFSAEKPQEDKKEKQVANKCEKESVDPIYQTTFDIDQEVESRRVALKEQFDEIMDSQVGNQEKLKCLFEIKDLLVEHSILSVMELEATIQNLTEEHPHAMPHTSTSQQVTSQERIKEDRHIMAEQERAYQESLRIDQEKERIRGITTIQAGIRGYLARQKFDQMRAEKKKAYEEFVNREFAEMEPLDAAIVQLIQAQDPDTAYNEVALTNLKLLQLFARKGRKIAHDCKKVQQKKYATQQEREKAMYEAIFDVLESEGGKELAERRAQRIVRYFLAQDEEIKPTESKAKSMPMLTEWYEKQAEIKDKYQQLFNDYNVQNLMTLYSMIGDLLKYRILNSEKQFRKVVLNFERIINLKKGYLNAIADGDLTKLQQCRDEFVDSGIVKPQEIDGAIKELQEKNAPAITTTGTTAPDVLHDHHDNTLRRSHGTGQSRYEKEGRGAEHVGEQPERTWSQWFRSPAGIITLGSATVAAGMIILKMLKK